MAKAGQAQEPSMEEILASIRRIISDEDTPEADVAGEVSEADATAEPEAVDMAAEAELEPEAGMSQDDLDKLFDEDGGGFDVAESEPEPDPEPEPEPEPETADDAVLELTEDFAVDAEDDEDDMAALMAAGDDVEDDVAFVADENAVDEVAADSAFEAVDAQEDAVKSAKAPASPPREPVMAASEYKPIPDHIEAIEDNADLLSSLTGGAVSSAFSELNHTVLSNNGKTLDDLVREMLRPMLKGWLEANLPTVVERMVRQEIERVSRGR